MPAILVQSLNTVFINSVIYNKWLFTPPRAVNQERTFISGQSFPCVTCHKTAASSRGDLIVVKSHVKALPVISSLFAHKDIFPDITSPLIEVRFFCALQMYYKYNSSKCNVLLTLIYFSVRYVLSRGTQTVFNSVYMSSPNVSPLFYRPTILKPLIKLYTPRALMWDLTVFCSIQIWPSDTDMVAISG